MVKDTTKHDDDKKRADAERTATQRAGGTLAAAGPDVDAGRRGPPLTSKGEAAQAARLARPGRWNRTGRPVAPPVQPIGSVRATQAARRYPGDVPEVGQLVVAERDGMPFLAQLKRGPKDGPGGAFYSQPNKGSEFSVFEGAVDGWVVVPEMNYEAPAETVAA